MICFQYNTTYETEVKDFFDIDRHVGVLSLWRTFPFQAFRQLRSIGGPAPRVRQERTSKTSIPSISLPISKKNTCHQSLGEHPDRKDQKCWLGQVMKRFRFETFMKFIIQSPKYGTFTEAARTDPEQYSHDTWRDEFVHMENPQQLLWEYVNVKRDYLIADDTILDKLRI